MKKAIDKIPKNGERYWAYIMTPSMTQPKEVVVTRENVDDNIIECGVDYYVYTHAS